MLTRSLEDDGQGSLHAFGVDSHPEVGLPISHQNFRNEILALPDVFRGIESWNDYRY
jgi:hypothetical protein